MAKVHEAREPVGAEHQVRGLDIAVRHAARVQVRQRPEHTAGDTGCRGWGQLATGLCSEHLVELHAGALAEHGLKPKVDATSVLRSPEQPRQYMWHVRASASGLQRRLLSQRVLRAAQRDQKRLRHCLDRLTVTQAHDRKSTTPQLAAQLARRRRLRLETCRVAFAGRGHFQRTTRRDLQHESPV